MKSKKKIIILVLCIIIGGSYLLYQNSNMPTSATVKIAQTEVASKISGFLTDLSVKEGDMIESGQLIAGISRPELEKKLETEQEAVDEAISLLQELQNSTYVEEKIIAAPAKQITSQPTSETTKKAKEKYEHYQQLYANDIISRQQLKEAKQNYHSMLTHNPVAAKSTDQVVQMTVGPDPQEIAKQQKEIARLKAIVEKTMQQFDEAVVLSPFQGLVLKKNRQNGDFIKAGHPILRLGNLQNCWVNINLSARKSKSLQLGQKITLTSPALPQQTFSGSIQEINTQNKSRLIQRSHIKIKINNDKLVLHPGMTVRVFLHP